MLKATKIQKLKKHYPKHKGISKQHHNVNLKLISKTCKLHSMLAFYLPLCLHYLAETYWNYKFSIMWVWYKLQII